MENTDDEEHKESGNLPKLSADFQCSVCGSIFTTDQDQEQRLKKKLMAICMRVVPLKILKLLGINKN